MNDTETVAANLYCDAFGSFEALRKAHRLLLKKGAHENPKDANEMEIENFLARAEKTGALLFDEDERAITQSILDYWGIILKQNGLQSSAVLLAEFDPTKAPELADDSCPYVGLSAFGENQRSLFYGREKLISQALQSLSGSRFLAVLGPSGSGKSSLVRAGVLPKLAESEKWLICPTIVPGSSPLASLAFVNQPPAESASLWRTREANKFAHNPNHLLESVEGSTDKAVLIFVDQFEELFTLCTSESERKAFVASLLALLQSDRGHSVVVTMREDYEEQVPKLPELQSYFQNNQIRVTPLDASGLREAIERPAELIGLKFEEGIVSALVKEVLGEPAALPLLQFTLLKLWENRERNLVTWDAYRRLGGPKMALRAWADEFYDGLPVEEQTTTRRVFMRLVRPTESLEVTSKRIRLDLLLLIEDPFRVRRVVDKLVEAKLLRKTKGETSADDQVEVAHEALIRNWPRLGGWLDDDRANSRRRLRLSGAAASWKEHGKDGGALYRGLLLAEAEQYDDLSPIEREFIHAGQSAATKRRWLLRVAWIALVALTFGALVWTWRALKDRNIAVSRELALGALLNLPKDPQLSLLLAMQAVSRTPMSSEKVTREAALALHQAIAASRVRAILRDHQSALINVVFSPDGKRLAACGTDGTASVWDVSSHKELLVLRGHEGSVTDIAFSPDGTRIATAGEHDGTARVWDSESGRELRVLSNHQGGFFGVAFSPDGTRVATAGVNGTVQLWNAQSGKMVLAVRNSEVGPVLRVTFSPDGKRFATASVFGTARVWNAITGKPLLTLENQQNKNNRENVQDIQGNGTLAVAFSPDGTQIATGDENGTVTLWDGFHGIKLRSLSRHSASVYGVAFSRDGKMLATASGDGTAKLWDVASNQEPTTLAGHGKAVYGIAFSPDGKQVATSSADATVRIWNAGLNGEISAHRLGDNSFQDAVLTSDGEQLATWGLLEPVQIWQAASGERIQLLPTRDVSFGTFSRDGRYLATVSSDRTTVWKAQPSAETAIWDRQSEDRIDVWDAQFGGRLATFTSHEAVTAVALSHDGRKLAAVAQGDKITLWDVTSNRTISVFSASSALPRPRTDSTKSVEGQVYNITFSPDGRQLATIDDSESIVVWDTSSGKSLFILSDPPINLGDVQRSAADNFGLTRHRGVVFSPDGDQLAVAKADNTIHIWNLASRSSHVLVGHTNGIVSLTFSPDGRHLASGGIDGSLRLWHLSPPYEHWNLSTDDSVILVLAISSDNKRIVATNKNGEVRTYALDIEELMRVARTRVCRPLTKEECANYLHSACPQSPEAARP